MDFVGEMTRYGFWYSWPNSAAEERIFSLLKLTFGDLRDTAFLADMMQATLMLLYNKRVNGHAE